ncbi:MAG TPA: prolyl oligopeptidase family serine peptidase [Acidobacteriaceae bacterium]|nr:prolyl oligopeptidase family serine peptidase [Acidobacteriaceae bacterium]
MNASEIVSAHVAPGGEAVVLDLSTSNWKHNRFDDNLWLWRHDTGKLMPLTHSGHDSSPVFSPGGRYVAFLSSRPLNDAGTAEAGKEQTTRVWIIPVNGGGAFPLYRENLAAHTFAWSEDGKSIDFSVTLPLSKDQKKVEQTQWKDVIRWRERDRGDLLLNISLQAAIHQSIAVPLPYPAVKPLPGNQPQLPQDAKILTRSKLEIGQITPSPDGKQIAFESLPPFHRLENPADYEVYLVPTGGGAARRITHNNGLESGLRWSADSHLIYFAVRGGSGYAEGPYRDVQGRIYTLNPVTGAITRLGADFKGSWQGFTVTPTGEVLAAGQTGVQQHLYKITGASYQPVATIPGNYARVAAASHSGAVIFTHSTINDPTQVYFAANTADLATARPITSFNSIFKQRAQVQWASFRWKSTDGTPVEGVLIYPPGEKGKKHLRMLTLIHGGPEDADGDRFGADWYDWATLAASRGWLVFRPNYRGSTGYGDAFMLAIVPHIVSAPGRDILSGVDALVKAGIADPNRLTIGGYSYGGYMTNWLITQTTRFKAAVTGAGAVEHAANWGNDDLTYDDAWFLSGTPWEKPNLYQSEAALFQLNKVTTPTHIVGGAVDVRVSWFEQTLLERALQTLGVPHELLLFPGENHPLDKNPWHGYIKVRDELKWLNKYVPQ